MPYFDKRRNENEYNMSCYRMHEMTFGEAMLIYDLHVAQLNAINKITEKIAILGINKDRSWGEMPMFQTNYETDHVGVSGFIPESTFNLCMALPDIKRYLKNLEKMLTRFNNVMYHLNLGDDYFALICPIGDIHPSCYMTVGRSPKDYNISLQYCINNKHYEKESFSDKDVQEVLDAFTKDFKAITPAEIYDSMICQFSGGYYSYKVITDLELAKEVINVKESNIPSDEKEKKLRELGLYDDYDLYLNIVKNANVCRNLYFTEMEGPFANPNYDNLLYELSQLLYPDLSIMEIAQKKPELRQIFGFAKGDLVKRFDRYVDLSHTDDSLRIVYGAEHYYPMFEFHRYRSGEKDMLRDDISECYGLPM